MKSYALNELMQIYFIECFPKRSPQFSAKLPPEYVPKVPNMPSILPTKSPDNTTLNETNGKQLKHQHHFRERGGAL